MKTRIVVNYQGRSHSVGWYKGATDASIRETIKDSFQIPVDSNIVLKDTDGTIVAITQTLPDGLVLNVEERASNNSISVYDPKNNTTTSTLSFRGELLKFERINSHLANERTWLAWVRTALSTLSCAFAFLTLSNSGYLEVFVYVLGTLFCVSVLVVFTTGWLRYTRVKEILGLSFKEMYVCKNIYFVRSLFFKNRILIEVKFNFCYLCY